jgi:hypothetical protein
MIHDGVLITFFKIKAWMEPDFWFTVTAHFFSNFCKCDQQSSSCAIMFHHIGKKENDVQKSRKHWNDGGKIIKFLAALENLCDIEQLWFKHSTVILQFLNFYIFSLLGMVSLNFELSFFPRNFLAHVVKCTVWDSLWLKNSI